VDTTTPEFKAKIENPEFVHKAMRRITDIIRHDIFSPPVASRIYAYATVAGYEALQKGYPEYKSLSGQLNALRPVPQPESGKEYCYPLASVHAVMTVGKHLIFSEAQMEELQGNVYSDFEKMDMPKAMYDRSMAYGEMVAQHIIEWSKSDNYAETRSAPKYTIERGNAARWTPTPPRYEDAMEPHWKDIRPWVMTAWDQFKPVPHIEFSTSKNSEFYKAAMEVYEKGSNLTEEQKETATYWDCNPFETEVRGHLMIPTKKITPGGHWINITAHAARKANKGVMESMEAYTLVSLALSEAFISCWGEKFTSNLTRPVTYINENIDPNWNPFIETPPFPEHTSGHATISAAAATVLTARFGEPFTFIDSTEMIFNMTPRTFNSFYEASDQAAMSRLWGGIHYHIGNEGGRISGREIGKFVLEKVKTK